MDLKDACLIYSLWLSYLDRDCADFREWAKRILVADGGTKATAPLSSDDAERRFKQIRIALPDKAELFHTITKDDPSGI